MLESIFCVEVMGGIGLYVYNWLVGLLGWIVDKIMVDLEFDVIWVDEVLVRGFL